VGHDLDSEAGGRPSVSPSTDGWTDKPDDGKDDGQALALAPTQFILNYKIFNFFNIKFDHLFYSKIYIKYHFIYRDLVY
jgi:hypothetical protein